jgi:stearoyl-CoA desaturase (delta-9 desaturase)
VRFSWGKTAWLWGHLLPALVLAPRHVGPGTLVAALLLTWLTLCLGHSVGLHRGLIHRTYAMPRAVERALVALFVLTGLGGPLSWIRLHHVRDHWQNQPVCPPYFAYRHGLLRDFVWNLHCRFEPRGWERYRVPAVLEKDAWLRFLERTWWAWVLAFHAAVAAVAGWEAALVAGVARVAGAVLGHWFIGYWTHKHGPRRFAIPGASETGTNSLVLGWISFGEGFHNNHHALPGSARMGIERHELDLGWLTLLALERVGLAREVRSWSRGNVVARGVPLRAPAGLPTRSGAVA